MPVSSCIGGLAIGSPSEMYVSVVRSVSRACTRSFTCAIPYPAAPQTAATDQKSNGLLVAVAETRAADIFEVCDGLQLFQVGRVAVRQQMVEVAIERVASVKLTRGGEVAKMERGVG